jgi:hypothetical protein
MESVVPVPPLYRSTVSRFSFSSVCLSAPASWGRGVGSAVPGPRTNQLPGLPRVTCGPAPPRSGAPGRLPGPSGGFASNGRPGGLAVRPRGFTSPQSGGRRAAGPSAVSAPRRHGKEPSPRLPGLTISPRIGFRAVRRADRVFGAPGINGDAKHCMTADDYL